MARIQILELPSEVVGENVSAPFALLIDQAAGEHVNPVAMANFKDAVGARGVAVFDGTIDLPANN